MSQESKDTPWAVFEAVEHLKDSREGKSKPFLVNLPSEIAIGLSILVNTLESSTATVGDWVSDEPREERFWSMINGRLTEAIESSESETIVPIEFSYREIDIIGDKLHQFRKDDPELFLGLNRAFIEAGGEDNSALRRAFELAERK